MITIQDETKYRVRLEKMTEIYRSCSNLQMLIRKYKETVPEKLQHSNVELLCIYKMLEHYFVWNSMQLEYNKLEDILINDEECEDINIEYVGEKNLGISKAKIADDNTIEETNATSWNTFFNHLLPEQMLVLKKIINDEFAYNSISIMAKQLHCMPEIMIEEINQIAEEYIGDLLIEMVGTKIYIYEEYKIELESYIYKK